ncbi:UNVERIFIED_CONTAM: hypothetical protein GTU68_017596, partial [Idotea baltica]|nr:hypothetical protein [Idotea baltica]
MNFDQFFLRPEFSKWQDHFRNAIAKRIDPRRHGDLNGWLKIVNELPNIEVSNIKLDQDVVTIECDLDLTQAQKNQLLQGLQALSPWRKGPFELFGIRIDTEWRSDWKWNRVQPHISDLAGRRVLDIGCGTGYHCWRMLGSGAKYVMGIDPSMRFVVQHKAINLYAQDSRFDFLPLGIEDMPLEMACFETVFSMGVLYHRRKPLDHMIELINLMTDGAELVLETLIIDDPSYGTLRPKERYAQMRNVWSVMTIEKILSLLEQAGFKNGRCVD